MSAPSCALSPNFSPSLAVSATPDQDPRVGPCYVPVVSVTQHWPWCWLGPPRPLAPPEPGSGQFLVQLWWLLRPGSSSSGAFRGLRPLLWLHGLVLPCSCEEKGLVVKVKGTNTSDVICGKCPGLGWCRAELSWCSSSHSTQRSWPGPWVFWGGSTALLARCLPAPLCPYEGVSLGLGLEQRQLGDLGVVAGVSHGCFTGPHLPPQSRAGAPHCRC